MHCPRFALAYCCGAMLTTISTRWDRQEDDRYAGKDETLAFIRAYDRKH